MKNGEKINKNRNKQQQQQHKSMTIEMFELILYGFYFIFLYSFLHGSFILLTLKLCGYLFHSPSRNEKAFCFETNKNTNLRNHAVSGRIFHCELCYLTG